jgi:hypothetical protein
MIAWAPAELVSDWKDLFVQERAKFKIFVSHKVI